MEPNISITNPSAATAQEPYAISYVTSKGGTIIGYRQLGPGLGW